MAALLSTWTEVTTLRMPPSAAPDACRALIYPDLISVGAQSCPTARNT